MRLRVALITNLSLLPEQALHRVLDLPKHLPVEFVLKDSEWLRETVSPLRGFDGLICRPNDGILLQPSDLQHANRPFFAISLSTGVDHFSRIANMPGVRIIAASGGNANAVAKWTIAVASELRRNIFRFADHAAQGHWDQGLRVRPDAQNLFPQLLDGLTWMTLGAGAQVRYLLPLLCSHGLQRVIVHNHRFTPEHFSRCTSLFSTALRAPVTQDPPADLAVTTETSSNGHNTSWYRTSIRLLDSMPTEVVGTNASFTSLLPKVDILSIHLPYNRETHHLVEEHAIDQLKHDACVVIASRGQIVDEEALVAAYDQQRLLGIAADVVTAEAERRKDRALSPLWLRTKTTRPDGSPENIIVTPHIGGQAMPDIAAICDEAVTNFETVVKSALTAESRLA